MKTVLVIEDNVEVRENTAEILQLANYRVLTAENGLVGVEVALREHPDLIVCDIMMPVLDGFGALHLLTKHPETAGIPFIFLSAKTDKVDLRRGMEMGADDYITKPFDGIDLLNAIDIRLKKNGIVRMQFGTSDPLDAFLKDVGKSGKLSLVSDQREVYTYNKKVVVYKEGQRPRVVYYVVSGKVKLLKATEEGKELITSIAGEGDFFGYASILEDALYKDKAEVLEETKLMLIPREDFTQLLYNDKEIASTFIKIITKNSVNGEENLLNLAYSSLRKKVAFSLLNLLETYRTDSEREPALNLSRENMAQSVGIATESLIRTLSEFKDEGLLDITGGKVIIRDEKALRCMRN